MVTRKIDFLMGIDHADWLLDVLCKIGNNGVTKAQFEDFLIEISKNRIKHRESKTIEMYRSWLSTLKLINDMHLNKKYTLTERGKKFCKEYSAGNKTRYKKMLRSYLFRNEKVGSHFKKFRKLVKDHLEDGKPITKDEIKDHFVGESHRVLFSLGRKAGIITVTKKEEKLGIKKFKKAPIKLTRFKNLVKKAYNTAIENNNGLHLQKHYVEIYKIRDDVLSYLGLEDPTEFDKLFTELLKNSTGKDIQIHSAAPQWFTDRGFTPEEASFRYEGKIYVFMSFN